MKKLMITAAIVCTAAFAQAAAIDWTASGVVDPWTTATAGKNTAANGWLGYCILAADYDTVVGDLAQGKTASLISSAIGDVKTSSSKGQFAATTAKGTVAAGDQDFYLIVLNSGKVTDATYFYASAAKTQNVDAELATVVNFPSQATASKPTTAWTSMAPEPTSGLLLLIGMAGLALKRKHA